MKRQLFVVGLAIAGLVAVGGCKHNKEEGDHETPMAMSDMPAGATAAFHRDHPGVTPMKTEKEIEKDGSTHYVFEYKDANGKKQEVEYDASGTQQHED